jgi:hypothetical protein
MFLPDVEDQITADAREMNATWHRNNPTRWATAPRLGFRDQLAVRHHELAIGRELTIPEQDQFLKELHSK